MLLETADTNHVFYALDRTLMKLIQCIRTPSVYKAGDWLIKVTSYEGHSTAVLPAPEIIADRLHACLTAYEAETEKWVYKRTFRNEFDDLWVCECTNES